MLNIYLRGIIIEVSTIKNEKDYENTMLEIDRLLNCDEGSEEAERLEILSILVEDYEIRFFCDNAMAPGYIKSENVIISSK